MWFEEMNKKKLRIKVDFGAMKHIVLNIIKAHLDERLDQHDTDISNANVVTH